MTRPLGFWKFSYTPHNFPWSGLPVWSQVGDVYTPSGRKNMTARQMSNPQLAAHTNDPMTTTSDLFRSTEAGPGAAHRLKAVTVKASVSPRSRWY